MFSDYASLYGKRTQAQISGEDLHHSGCVQKAARAKHRPVWKLHPAGTHIRHRIHGIGYHQNDAPGIIALYLRNNALHNRTIVIDQIQSCFAGPSVPPGRDNNQITIAAIGIVSGANGRHAHCGNAMLNVVRFPFRLRVICVDQHDFTGQGTNGQSISDRGAYVADADNGNLFQTG